MSTPRVGVVIVTFNSQRTIERSLLSLRDAHEAGIARTIVVDNTSTDRTREILRQHEAWATIVLSDENLGFGRGCNRGAIESSSPYLFFLNPDAAVAPADIDRLADFLDRHPKAAIVAPAIREHDTSLQHAGGLPTPAHILRRALGLPVRDGRRDIVPGDEPFRTDWVCGAALMIRRETFERLSGFDPRFFLYFEETDLCVRAARDGAEIWAEPSALAEHTAGDSSAEQSDRHYAGCLAAHYFPSRYYYLRKHHGVVAAALTESLEMLILALRGLLTRRARRRLSERLRGPVLRLPRRLA